MKDFWRKRNQQEAELHCETFRQDGTEMIDWTNNIWFKKRVFEQKKLSMEILMEEIQPMWEKNRRFFSAGVLY